MKETMEKKCFALIHENAKLISELNSGHLNKGVSTGLHHNNSCIEIYDNTNTGNLTKYDNSISSYPASFKDNRKISKGRFSLPSLGFNEVKTDSKPSPKYKHNSIASIRNFNMKNAWNTLHRSHRRICSIVILIFI